MQGGSEFRIAGPSRRGCPTLRLHPAWRTPAVVGTPDYDRSPADLTPLPDCSSDFRRGKGAANQNRRRGAGKGEVGMHARRPSVSTAFVFISLCAALVL